MTLALFAFDGAWHHVRRTDARARALADRHYSRQTVGAAEFLPNGRTFVLVTLDALAVWGVCHNLDMSGAQRFRCTIFRNEGPTLSSTLIREATSLTFGFWRAHYGAVPPVPLTTEIDSAKTRRKRDPGRCFRRAGWRLARIARGLHVFEAPCSEAA